MGCLKERLVGLVRAQEMSLSGSRSAQEVETNDVDEDISERVSQQKNRGKKRGHQRPFRDPFKDDISAFKEMLQRSDEARLALESELQESEKQEQRKYREGASLNAKRQTY